MLAMTDVSYRQVDEWIDGIDELHSHVAGESDDERAAGSAIATLWSEFDLRNAPRGVLHMLVQAMEIGYMTALRDVRNGAFDRQLGVWRPDLTDS